MHTPHPSQIRSSCERCRKQKLRCSRQPGAGVNEPCARCARLGFLCEAGLQRKIGRPGKTNPPTAPAVDTSITEIYLNDDPVVDLSAQEPTHLLEPSLSHGLWDGTIDDGFLSDPNLNVMDFNWPSTPRTIMPPPPPPSNSSTSTRSTQLATVHDPDFDNLSKVNILLRTLYYRLAVPRPREDTDLCTNLSVGDLPDLDVYQGTMKVTQDFLRILKSIHRQLWVRAKVNSQMSPASAADREDGGQTQSPLDRATTVLIVSCYVQLIQLYEVMVKEFDVFCTLTKGSTMATDPLDFAGTPIVDFSSQAIIFTELSNHLLRQINLVVGMPGAWSGKTPWTGLLTGKSDQELLQRELNGPRGAADWSIRPKKMMEDIQSFRMLMEECSMLTQY